MELKALIVDDDIPTVELISTAVDWRALGISKVSTAYNIVQARQVLERDGADIVISDIEMPRGSGLELLRWYREQDMDGEFLLLTCHERFDYAMSAVKLRANEFLLKPFDVEVMENALRKLISELMRRRGVDNPPPAAEKPLIAEPETADLSAVLELDRLYELLEEKKKLELLNYVRRCLSGTDAKRLRSVRHEIIQAVYGYLGERELSVAYLFSDRSLERMAESADNSATDLLRWFNYLLECTFNYEEKMRRRSSLSDRVDDYIREHYAEDIGRNEIAAEFFLSPEYLAKTYKKQTGVNLGDAINICRIEKAKKLLDRGEKVGDVALAVGFNNFTYFSTIFKKHTGISPGQYKNR